MLPLIIIKIYFNLKFSNILLRVFLIQSWYITSHISQYGVSILVNIAVSSTHTEVFGTLPLTAWSAQCTNDTLIVWRPVSTDTRYTYYTTIKHWSTPPSSVSKSTLQLLKLSHLHCTGEDDNDGWLRTPRVTSFPRKSWKMWFENIHLGFDGRKKEGKMTHWLSFYAISTWVNIPI